MSPPWVIDPEALIEEVEARPLLYSKSLKSSDKRLKKDAWSEVTQILSEDWEMLTNEERGGRCRELQLKWKHIRDNFRREYQIQKEYTPEQDAKKKKKAKYRYYDRLLFLMPHTNETLGTLVATPQPPPKTQESSKKKSSFEDEVLKALRKRSEVPDEDKLFCLSLVQSLKKMDDDTKISAKIGILNVIRTFSNNEQSEPAYSYYYPSDSESSSTKTRSVPVAITPETRIVEEKN